MRCRSGTAKWRDSTIIVDRTHRNQVFGIVEIFDNSIVVVAFSATIISGRSDCQNMGIALDQLVGFE
ncbi:hypothetical protein D1872_333610 [compost metagenome]